MPSEAEVEAGARAGYAQAWRPEDTPLEECDREEIDWWRRVARAAIEAAEKVRSDRVVLVVYGNSGESITCTHPTRDTN